MAEEMNKVYIIGVGPGAKECLLPVAKKEIERAECLIGAKRLLGLFASKKKRKIYIDGHFDEVVSYIKENRCKERIAVLVSGDPGLYSFLGQISSVLSKEEYAVIPGISAVQIAFARIGEGWENAKIISLHGRKIANFASQIKRYPKAFLFTDSNFPPDRIASYLIDKGAKNRGAVVFENLTYPNERIIDTDLERLSKMKGFGLCVMIIKR